MLFATCCLNLTLKGVINFFLTSPVTLITKFLSAPETVISLCLHYLPEMQLVSSHFTDEDEADVQIVS